MSDMRFSRAFSMPDRYTFRMKPVAELLDRYQVDPMRAVDPFCGVSERAYYRNDLAEHKMKANDFLDWCIEQKITAELVLLDPPYSPRQIKESYESVGLECSQSDTQNAKLYKDARDRLNKILIPGGIAISCGWNSTGFGGDYELIELLLVNHGGAHHDTIVLVERKP